MEIQEEKGNFYRPKWELKAKGQPHPARRWCHTATAYGSSLFIMGGRLAESAKAKEFIYKINCQTFESEQIQLSENIMSRESHSCSIINDSIYVLFGISKKSNVLKDCAQLKIGQNSLIYQKKQQKPEIDPRQSHMSILLENRFILIYGGVDSNQKILQDFYLYDVQQQTWRKISKITGKVDGKVGGSLITIKNQIYLFGGQINDQNQYSNQIYKIQIKNYQDYTKQHEPQIIIHQLNVYGRKPLPRSQFASAVFKDRFLIILGGQTLIKQKSQSPTLLADIWAFDTEKCIWEEIIPQNANIFKPRSSFTATVYKQSLLIFGGLIGLKDFRSTDQFFVLNLNTQVQKRPTCNLCKSSYKVYPKQEITIQKPQAKSHSNNFNTSFSTIFAISQQIQNPFIAIGTLLHSFDHFKIQKCSLMLTGQHFSIKIKKLQLNSTQWNKILFNYEFSPLIDQPNHLIRSALKTEIYENKLNYLSYNIKNCCFRLGNQILISYINGKKQLEIYLLNKFGIFHTQNLFSQNSNVSYAQNTTYPSHSSIILQHIKQNNININQLFQNSLTIIISSLKRVFNKYENELYYSKQKNDIVMKETNKQKELKNYLNLCFSERLSYDLFILNQESLINNGVGGQTSNSYPNNKVIVQIEKWPQQNEYPELFDKIYTYSSTQNTDLAVIYQNNKLMHAKTLKNFENDPTVYQFHLTNKIQPNLTFSDVQPTQQLIEAIKTVIKSLNNTCQKTLKRVKSVQRQIIDSNTNSPDKQSQENGSSSKKKTVKTNQPQNGQNYMQIQCIVRQQGQL